MSSRGAEAYDQAYRYVAAGNPGVPGKELRAMALAYLQITADPPLTPDEQLAAEQRAREEDA